MREQVFFSVIIPTFNRASVITQTIESVLAQSFPDFEIIIIDDGSTDNTAEVIEKIKDARIFYHRKENEERSVARNTGVRLARGKYVSFLDSDDLLYKNHLQVALEMIENHENPECFHLGFELKDISNGKIKATKLLPAVANDILIDGNTLSCNSVFLRKDIAEEFSFNPLLGQLKGAEDYQLWLRLASRFPFHCNNKVTSAVILENFERAVETDKQMLIRRFQVLEETLEKDEVFVKKFRKKLTYFKANNKISIAINLAMMKRRGAAIKYIVKAIRISPQVLRKKAFYGAIKGLLK